MNLTDVDDKTIKGAIKNNVSLMEYTEPYKKAFFEDLHSLNIQPAERYPAATSYIPAMIEMIQQLLDKGFAYQGGDGSIYYAIRKFPKYGCLSHLKLDELQTGASERIAADEYDKESASDFVLWKKYDPTRDGGIFWESPFGQGRPGWHLECSAMAKELLGESIDIHVGGIDNMFPHHENEIAQTEACTGKTFAKMWMHSEHLIVENKKMSKSLNNFYTFRDLQDKGFTGIQVRYMLMQTHYKTQLNFTFVGLESVKSSLQRLSAFITRLLEVQQHENATSGEWIDEELNAYHHRFATALADDLNISVALATLFDMVREINSYIDQKRIFKIEATRVLDLLRRFDTVLGVLPFPDASDTIPEELEKALADRIEARNAKDWKKADLLRDFIASKGYVIEDTATGARLKKVE